MAETPVLPTMNFMSEKAKDSEHDVDDSCIMPGSVIFRLCTACKKNKNKTYCAIDVLHSMVICSTLSRKVHAQIADLKIIRISEELNKKETMILEGIIKHYAKENSNYMEQMMRAR